MNIAAILDVDGTRVDTNHSPPSPGCETRLTSG
jgi:hypothetical protein